MLTQLKRRCQESEVWKKSNRKQTTLTQSIERVVAAYVSFKHSGHEVDPFRGRMFVITHPNFRHEDHRMHEFRACAIHMLSKSDFLWDVVSMNTILGLVALASFKDSLYCDDVQHPFVYPSVVAESPYYDRALERNGCLNIDVQLDPNLLKAPNGEHCSDIMLVVSNGDRRYGHYTLVHVQKDAKHISVCDPYHGCFPD